MPLTIFSFVIIAILCATLDALAADGADVYDLGNTDVTILNPDNQQVLGHGHYQVTRSGGAMQFEGENRFLDGEDHHEMQCVGTRYRQWRATPPPQAFFFNADGSPESLRCPRKLLKTGTLACNALLRRR